MDEKSKLVVFDKKEVFLIFVFMTLIATTFFTLGVRVGKGLSFKNDGFVHGDKEKVDLQSPSEESVDTTPSDAHGAPAVHGEHGAPAAHDAPVAHDSHDPHAAPAVQHGQAEKEDDSDAKAEETQQRLQAEFNKLNEQLKTGGQAASKEISSGHNAAKSVPSSSTAKQAAVKGKQTIQLGSYANMDDAIKFADGFKIRGYNPIVNEVNLPGKGVWYRVSLGVFDSIAEAKEYVLKEQGLFQGQDYVITELQ